MFVLSFNKSIYGCIIMSFWIIARVKSTLTYITNVHSPFLGFHYNNLFYAIKIRVYF